MVSQHVERIARAHLAHFHHRQAALKLLRHRQHRRTREYTHSSKPHSSRLFVYDFYFFYQPVIRTIRQYHHHHNLNHNRKPIIPIGYNFKCSIVCDYIMIIEIYTSQNIWECCVESPKPHTHNNTNSIHTKQTVSNKRKLNKTTENILIAVKIMKSILIRKSFNETGWERTRNCCYSIKTYIINTSLHKIIPNNNNT